MNGVPALAKASDPTGLIQFAPPFPPAGATDIRSRNRPHRPSARCRYQFAGADAATREEQICGRRITTE